MKVSTALDLIDNGNIALPEFQRGYVWNRDQVRGLMWSLYKKHPIGSLLIWVTKKEKIKIRGNGKAAADTIQLLLDGQQRVTTLYGIIRGEPPKFFDGNAAAFTGLYFNLESEVFEFFAPLKMKDNPLWTNVTELLQPNGLGPALQKVLKDQELEDKQAVYIERLNAINDIQGRELHVEHVTGDDKSVDVVVDIFNRVNSGGTKLSKGDLALARICANWPEARQEMKKRLKKWQDYGFDFKLELSLRSINTITTGEALFSALKNVTVDEFQEGLKKAEKYTDYCLNLISSRLGLDHDRVLGSRYSLPLLVRYLHQRGGRLSDHKERDRLLHWYVHTFLWGRYSGSTESVLNQDLRAIQDIDQGIENLVTNLRNTRGDLEIKPDDFRGWSRGARFYPLLYMLTRLWHTKDFESDLELSQHMLGVQSNLELHHIFPKSQLYDAGYKRPEVNALANFTFLTKDTNILISDELPEVYLKRYAEKEPGLVESHWIPMDRSLWKMDRYLDFLEARRELLAKAANDFLDNLAGGKMPEAEIKELTKIEVPVAETDEEALLREVNEWVKSKGLPGGEYDLEVTDEETGNLIAVIDLGWPDGLQEGLSEPVALLIDGDKNTLKASSQAGYKLFDNVEKFKRYVARHILAEVED